jgi:hypothetical protein
VASHACDALRRAKNAISAKGTRATLLIVTGTNGTDLFPALTAAPATVSSTVPVTVPAPAPAPPPLEPSSYHATALTNTATPALLSTSDPLTTQGLGHVRFGDSPEVNFISPHSYSSRTETTSPSGEHDARTGDEHRDNEGEERLASATKDGFGPPFQSLVYQVSMFDLSSCMQGGSH